MLTITNCIQNTAGELIVNGIVNGENFHIVLVIEAEKDVKTGLTYPVWKRKTPSVKNNPLITDEFVKRVTDDQDFMTKADFYSWPREVEISAEKNR